VPCLAVLVLDRARSSLETDQGVLFPVEVRKQLKTGTSRLVITSRAVIPNFKIALVPFRFGDVLPTVATDEDARSATLTWTTGEKGKAEVLQSDVITFAAGDEGRTRVSVVRGGTKIIGID